MTHTKTTGIPLTNRVDKMTREQAKGRAKQAEGRAKRSRKCTKAT